MNKQGLAEDIADAFAAVDGALRFTYWDHTAEKLTGLPAGQAVGRSLDELFPEFSQACQAALRSRQPQRLERQCAHGGTTARFEISLYPAGDGLSIFVRNAAPAAADHAAMSLENTRLREAAEQERAERKHAEQAVRQLYRELALINSAGRAFISTLDLDEVLSNVLEQVRHLLDAVACSGWLVDPQTKELVCRQATGPKHEMVRGWRLPPGQGLVGKAAQTGQSLLVSDAQSDPDHFRGVGEKIEMMPRSILSIPLRTKTGVIGVIQVVDVQANRFTEADLHALEPLSVTAAIAIENAWLYEQALRDAQTQQALLHEINHRVKNNLSAIIGLLYAERRRVQAGDRATYEAAMDDLINRISGLSAVHTMLSAANWAPVRLCDLARRIIESSLRVSPHSQRISVEIAPSPVTVTPDQAHNLALVINELTTNTIKQTAQSSGDIRIIVKIEQKQDAILFEFRDTGPGYPDAVLRQETSGLGLDLMRKIVRWNLGGEIALSNARGAVATLQFKPESLGD